MLNELPSVIRPKIRICMRGSGVAFAGALGALSPSAADAAETVSVSNGVADADSLPLASLLGSPVSSATGIDDASRRSAAPLSSAPSSLSDESFIVSSFTRFQFRCRSQFQIVAICPSEMTFSNLNSRSGIAACRAPPPQTSRARPAATSTSRSECARRCTRPSFVAWHCNGAAECTTRHEIDPAPESRAPSVRPRARSQTRRCGATETTAQRRRSAAHQGATNVVASPVRGLDCERDGARQGDRLVVVYVRKAKRVLGGTFGDRIAGHRAVQHDAKSRRQLVQRAHQRAGDAV
jgi:hypothetical protein